MTILDLNETILSPKKISECKTEEQLILYLKLDLLSQAINKGKYFKYNIITITDEVEKDYTLNIRAINNDNLEDKISIPFYLENLIYHFSKEKENKYELNYNINFENIIISSGLCIQNVNFNGSVYFRNTTLQLNVGFYNSNFNKLLVFSHSNFYKMQRLEFDNIEFNNMLSFAYCDFKCRAEIKESKFNGISFFIRNTFHSILIFSKKCELNNIICFYISNFKSNLEFKNTTMNTIMYFRGSTINKLSFNEIKFNDNNSILSIDNNFIENNFYDSLFNYLLEDEKKEILKDINKKNNEINKMHFYNIRITGKIDLQNIEVKEADFKGSIIDGGLINPVNFKVNKFANRESALFLKQQAYARNNAIDALQYQAQEVELHKEELKEQFKENKNLKTFGDILSIELSSLYSDNGQNWIKAFICTILFPMVFFTLSFAPYTVTLFTFIILSFAYPIFYNNNITKYILFSFIAYLIISFLYMFNDNSHLNFIKELFSFLTPTNFNQIVYNNENPSYIHSNNSSYIELIFKCISYFMGKIAFWYGSVQTVQAFRKFAKGA
ncbi:hypothetical protein [Brachyspira hyodysenteriae]|uniref:hypothetical protein n=1 Tax=Brachyspira hyodysenteriae TaxID=159 RepID=UPI003A80BFDE